MLNWFRKDPTAKLQTQYDKKLEESMQAQRQGNIVLYAQLVAESEEIARQIDQVRAGH